MTRLSNRVKAIAPSATVALSDKARSMAAAGIDVINLAGGEPDFATPPHILEAGYQAMQQGATHYVSSRGIPELLDAVAAKYEAEQGLVYDPATEVLVSAGGKMALYAAVVGAVNRGDEVLIPAPAWVSYEPIVQLADGVPVMVPLDGADGFRITRDVLETKVTPGTRVILLNSPNNPTGRVLTKKELEAVAGVAAAHDLLVISDEIYEYLLYDGHQHTSIATLPGMWARTIVVNGLSKSYAMTGWRIGTAVAPKEIIGQMLKVQQHTVTCAAAFTQYAAAAALNGPRTCVTEMLAVYRQRRNLVAAGLSGLPGVNCPAPEGAFYAFADIRETGMSSAEFTERMLDQANVVMTPGSAFGGAGEGYVRLSFANATEKLEEAIKRLAKVL